MTRTAPVASPVDFDEYGDYTPKVLPTTAEEFVRPQYPFQGRITADGSSGSPRRWAAITCTCPWPARGRTAR